MLSRENSRTAIHLPYEQGAVLGVILDFNSSQMKAEGDVRETGSGGAENPNTGFPSWRTVRRREN